MKSSKMSPETLYVPFYLRHFNASEKIIIALLVFVSSIAVGLIPIVYASTNTVESTTTPIYSSEVDLWRVLGERD
ncbi:hypothetical protein IQ255_19200 [Pleurocapsales cyanobacterium LEGE 10410]|nr:hypothetical protein [Pleurocapsales cyanobacterium LEGE 10410]